MNRNHYLSGIAFSCCILAVCSCKDKQKTHETHFTKADSLTETYLDLKDSMFQTWNIMINDDNQKIKAMRNLLHELEISAPEHREEFEHYRARLDELEHSRYTQKSMKDPQIVEEYDFASNSLVSELISLAESQTQFAYNTTMQKLVEIIRTADQRVVNYRQEYDRIASQFNRFVDRNKSILVQVDKDVLEEKKTLFQMVADE